MIYIDVKYPKNSVQNQEKHTSACVVSSLISRTGACDFTSNSQNRKKFDTLKKIIYAVYRFILIDNIFLWAKFVLKFDTHLKLYLVIVSYVRILNFNFR